MSHVSEPWKNAPFTDAGQLSQPEKKAIHTIEAQFLHTYYILEFSRQKWAKLKLGSEWCKLRLVFKHFGQRKNDLNSFSFSCKVGSWINDRFLGVMYKN
mgnify:FL=1